MTSEGGSPLGTAQREGEQPGGLQFEEIELKGQVKHQCARCQRAISDEYFEVKGAMLCASCGAELGGGSGGAGAFWRAFGYGLGAAVVGTIIWVVIRQLKFSYEGLVAIGVGFLVGMAVRRGSGGRGGRRYQILAMALTYFSITSSYAPYVAKGLTQATQHKTAESEGKPPEAASGLVQAAGLATALVIVLALSMAAPFLTKSLMAFVIIGIALYEAWKINRGLPITGPFRIASPPPAPA